MINCQYEECASWKAGACVSLSDTDFYGRMCPFYKDRVTAHADRELAKQRCEEIGIKMPYEGPRFENIEDWKSDLKERGIIEC